jgi:hypothetical protein
MGLKNRREHRTAPVYAHACLAKSRHFWRRERLAPTGKHYRVNLEPCVPPQQAAGLDRVGFDITMDKQHSLARLAGARQ